MLAVASAMSREGIAVPVLLQDTPEPIPGCEIFSARSDADDWRERAAALLVKTGKQRGVSHELARESLKNPLLLAATLVRLGYVDVGIAGSIATTAEVLRAGIRGIGIADGASLISSILLMELPDGRILSFSDCAVVPTPNAEQLAEIALSSARTHQHLLGEAPKVALLSFSSKGSAEHPKIEAVRQALAIAQQRDPTLDIDGELQFDAALMPQIAAKKAPHSAVAGQANVFVFPDLNAANIGCKITEHLGGANVIGPILQGFSRPWIDLSRGGKTSDYIEAAIVASALVIRR